MTSETLDAASINPDEVAKFARMAEEWWNPDGEARPLHRLNPVRVAYIRDQLCRRFGRDPRARRPLSGLRLVDVGCGGGLLCEPLARLGAQVTGIDVTAQNIGIARAHADRQGLEISYQHTSAENLVERGCQYDGVISMEVVEHVADVDSFLASCAQLVVPGGLLLLSTLNRTAKSFALGIVGAEYLLRWVPRGTHDWQKFLSPDELAASLQPTGFRISDVSGMRYLPLRDRFEIAADTSVNYLVTARKS